MYSEGKKDGRTDEGWEKEKFPNFRPLPVLAEEEKSWEVRLRCFSLITSH